MLYQKTEFHRKSPLLWMLFISLGVHSAFLMLKWNSVDVSEETTSKQTFVELSPLPAQESNRSQSRKLPLIQNQVVESEDAGNRKLDPNASLLSDKTQTATQQTRSERVDDFKKGQGTGAKAEQEQALVAPGVFEADSLLVPDTETQPQKKHWSKLSLKDLSLAGDGKAASASDDYLPGVASGERTILSTREFKYFSYYNRIKDLLRQFWKPSIEREVSKLWGKGQMLRENELVTRLLVLLDEKGQVQKVSKVGASGVSEIDEVAVQAFYAASPFPNPPTALIESDGFVRLKWDFILQTSAAPRIQYSPRNPSNFR